MYLQEIGTTGILVQDNGVPLNDTSQNLQLHPAYLTGKYEIISNLPNNPFWIKYTVDIPNAAVPPDLAKGVQNTKGFTVQNLKDAGRTFLCFYATNVAPAATGTEAIIPLSKNGAAPANSFVITNGKFFQITDILVASRGHNTATAQVTTFSLRTENGAITVNSAAAMKLRTATPATALAWDRLALPIPDGIVVVGNGTLQFGFTANAVYVTNAPTLDVMVLGFEY